MDIVESGGGGHELKDAAGLLAAGFDGGQQHLGEATDLRALSAEAEFAPDETAGRSACSLALMVGSTPSWSRSIHSQWRCCGRY